MQNSPTIQTESTADLGPLLYHGRRSAKRTAIWCFVVAVSFLVFGVIIMARLNWNGPSPTRVALFLCLAAILMVSYTVAGFVSLYRGDREIHLFETGLRHQTKHGETTLRYDEMDGFCSWTVSSKIPYTIFKFIPRGADPHDQRLAWSAGTPEAMQKVRDHLAEQFARPMQASLENGQSVPWGPVTLTRTGFLFEGKFVRYDEVSQIRLGNDKLVISTTDQGALKLATNTLNFWSFYAILRRNVNPAAVS